MRNLLLLVSGLCLVGCDNQKPQKSAATPGQTENAAVQSKTQFVGRWTNKDLDKSRVPFSSTDVFQRNITLGSDGRGAFLILENQKEVASYRGQWNLQGDILYLDCDNGVTHYWRILRVSSERLVLRNDLGVERIYDRIQ